jgi:hypothetical protein
MLHVVDALRSQRPCPCDCHHTLGHDERRRGVDAIYFCDDALRGLGYVPMYDHAGDALWREAQSRNDASYRGVAVRFGECIYRRLLGSMLHELIHAGVGDPTQANYGIPFGLPYGVPMHVPPSDEEAFLAPFNFGEARAFVGVWILGMRLFGIDWDIRTARDVGTYGFVGGNALVSVPKGFRPVAHIDRTHHPERYYARARRLEAEARAWFEDATNLDALVGLIQSAAARGRETRDRDYPSADAIARITPKKIGRNDPCVCGRPKKYKQCCGALDAAVAAQSVCALPTR